MLLVSFMKDRTQLNEDISIENNKHIKKATNLLSISCVSMTSAHCITPKADVPHREITLI